MSPALLNKHLPPPFNMHLWLETTAKLQVGVRAQRRGKAKELFERGAVMGERATRRPCIRGHKGVGQWSPERRYSSEGS